MKTPESRTDVEERATPPSQSPRLRLKLKTIDDVAAELARLYRQAKAGQVAVADASKLANILALLGRVLEGSQLESRLDALEADRDAQLH